MSLRIQVSISNGSATFDLSPPVGFDFLVVSNADQRVFWEVKPTSMQPVTIIEAEVYSVAISPEAESEMTAFTKSVGDNPSVASMRYGEVPQGYREVVAATTLQAGENYCVFVYGDGFEKAWQYFHL